MRGVRNFDGEIFYQVVGIWGGVILTIQTFFKAKRKQHSVNTEIQLFKITMTCVYKEYEVKTKLVQQQGLKLKIIKAKSFYLAIT